MNEFKMLHFGISVVDLERTVKWYKENFGFKEVRRFENLDFEIKAAVLELNGFTLEAIQPDTPDHMPEGGNSLKEQLRKTGVNHFALSSDELISFYDRLKANNVELVTDIIDNRLFFCKDPDGTLIEVKQGK